MHYFNALKYIFTLLSPFLTLAIGGSPRKLLLSSNKIQETNLRENSSAADEMDWDSENLVGLCQISDMPLLEASLFDQQRMGPNCENITKAFEIPQVETELDENIHFADQFFADYESVADDDDQLNCIKSGESSETIPPKKMMENMQINEKIKLKLAENAPTNEIEKLIENDRLNKLNYYNTNICKMVAYFKIRHQQRWKIIHEFLLGKNAVQKCEKLPKISRNKNENSDEKQKGVKNKKPFSETENLQKKNKKSKMMFDQNVDKEQRTSADKEAKEHVILKWHLIGTAIFCVELSLLPIAAALNANNNALFVDRYLYRTIDIDQALCALISADQAINDLKAYINGATKALMDDAMFDATSAVRLMKNMKNDIKRTCKTSKTCYDEQNKMFLNLRVYARLYATIERQISTRTIEDTVDGMDNRTALSEWVTICMFVRDFVTHLNELLTMAAEIGIEQAKQRQCKTL